MDKYIETVLYSFYRNHPKKNGIIDMILDYFTKSGPESRWRKVDKLKKTLRRLNKKLMDLFFSCF